MMNRGGAPGSTTVDLSRLRPTAPWLGAASPGGDTGLCTVTGLSSAGWYGVLSAAGAVSLYVGDVGAARELLEVRETRAFSTVELIEGLGSPWTRAVVWSLNRCLVASRRPANVSFLLAFSFTYCILCQ